MSGETRGSYLRELDKIRNFSISGKNSYSNKVVMATVASERIAKHRASVFSHHGSSNISFVINECHLSSLAYHLAVKYFCNAKCPNP